MRIGMGDLTVGTVFSYRGPRGIAFWRRPVAHGMVIGLDEIMSIIHVRTFRFDAKGPDGTGEGEPSVDIGHLPLLFASFQRSVVALHSQGRPGSGAWQSVAAWRERHSAGEVGAFSIPLWKAERLAWEATREGGADESAVFIESAFPVPDGDGCFRVVRAECLISGEPAGDPHTIEGNPPGDHRLRRLLSGVQSRWRSFGVETEPPSSLADIREFEANYAVSVPDDLVQFLTTIGGMPEGETDEHAIRFWSLREWRPVRELIPEASEGFAGYFVFADYSIWAHAYAVQLGESRPSSVVIVGEAAPIPVATSFTEFVDGYSNEPATLFPPRGDAAE